MSFKNRLMSKIPASYILHKSSNKTEAKLIVKGYNAIRKNNLFDDEFYLNKYPKVKASGMDPLLHYIFFGFNEGKKPNKDFDGVFYKYHYDDVEINPLIHYALYGIDENRQIKVANEDLANFNDLNKTNILFVLHEKIGTIGGTGFTNLDIINSLDKRFGAFILTSDGEDVELWKFTSSLEKIANFNCHPKKYEFLDNRLAGIYEEILSKLDIKIIHINHLINHTFDLAEIANKKRIPYIVSIHDFYYICPSIHLINENYSYCEFKCKTCKFETILKDWQKYGFKLLENAYLNNDEQDIKRKWNKFFKTDYFTSNSQQKNRCENNEMFIENIYSIDKLMPIKFEIKCQRYISKDNFKNSTYVNCFDNQKFSITQNRDEKLCFSIDTIIPKPYILLWKIKNNGNYAIENNSLRGEIYYGNNLNSFADDSQSFKRFESISFKGNHYVECYLIKDNKCIAKSRFNVNIE